MPLTPVNPTPTVTPNAVLVCQLGPYPLTFATPS